MRKKALLEERCTLLLLGTSYTTTGSSSVRSPATAVYLVFQPFTRLHGPRRGRQLSQSKDAHKGYCHYSQHSLCGNGARMPHTLGNVSFLDLMFIAPPVAVMQAQSRCLHNGCAIRNPCTTCLPHLHMAPAPEQPHLHMAFRTCTWSRTAAAYNVSPRTHQACTSHPQKQAYHSNNYSTSTDIF